MTLGLRIGFVSAPARLARTLGELAWRIGYRHPYATAEIGRPARSCPEYLSQQRLAIAEFTASEMAKNADIDFGHRSLSMRVLTGHCPRPLPNVDDGVDVLSTCAASPEFEYAFSPVVLGDVQVAVRKGMRRRPLPDSHKRQIWNAGRDPWGPASGGWAGLGYSPGHRNEPEAA